MPFLIRPFHSFSEIKAAEQLQREVWGEGELAVVPDHQLIAVQESGGLLIGAFDGSSLAGFVYAFLGSSDGHWLFHSHMLAVKPSCRGLGLGRLLKLAQREEALRRGIDCITWTFDPLQSVNARLNLEQLGALGTQYKVNLYGQDSSLLLPGQPTDRLWVDWRIDSRRVRGLLLQGAPAPPQRSTPLLTVGADERPVLSASRPEDGSVSIAIPRAIQAINEKAPEIAGEWRLAGRQAFTACFERGYLVAGFRSASDAGPEAGRYLLERKPLEELIE